MLAESGTDGAMKGDDAMFRSNRHGGDSSLLLALVGWLIKLSRSRLMCAAVLFVAVIGIGDYATGPDVSFGVVYLIPVFLSAAATRGAGVAIAGTAAATWSVIEMMLRAKPFDNAWVPAWNVAARFAVLALVAALVSTLAVKLADESRRSRTDPLTDLLNARGFYEAAEAEIDRMRRAGRPLTTAYLDIDDFKAVNDVHGHQAGDKVLHAVARTMTSVMRGTDQIARLGGDEFAILLPGTDLDTACDLLGRLHAGLHTVTSQHDLGIGFSIGAVTFTDPPSSGHELVECADRLMYEVKRNGKNMVICSPASASSGSSSSTGGPLAVLDGMRVLVDRAWASLAS
jgi:diguanylate cyclase (GGDEF)-like protein